jgi:hypothetical protein
VVEERDKETWRQGEWEKGRMGEREDGRMGEEETEIHKVPGEFLISKV